MGNENFNEQEKLLRNAALETANSILVLKNREEQKLLETQLKLQKALNEVKRAEAEFSSAFEYAPIGMALVGIKGELLRVNKSVCHLFGYNKEELLRLNVRHIIHPDDLYAGTIFFEQLILGKIDSHQAEKEFLTKNGDTIWVNLSISLINNSDGSPKHFVVQLMDITQKKNAENALRKSEKEAQQLAKHYKSILDSQSVYIVKTDIFGRYTYVNDYYLRIFGFGYDLIGMGSLDNILEEDHPACIAAAEKCFQQPETPHEVILRKTKTDGTPLGGKWEFKGILDKEGNVYEILCVGFDITEQLENLDKTRHLLEITSDQNIKLKSFAYIVSHNIRSHSANFTGLLSMLKDTTDEIKKATYLNMLNSSASQLEQTILNLNDIITVHENVSKPKELRNLNQEVNKTLQIMNGAIMKHQIQVEVSITESLFVHIIPAYLDSILLNLISNAIKYRAVDRKAVIEIYGEQKNHSMILYVKDNGLGIDLKKYGDKLFGMYKKFHSNEDARGLGLYMAKIQAEAMGGNIEVESEEGKGSTFKVYFNETT